MPRKSFKKTAQELLRQNKPEYLDRFDRYRASFLGLLELDEDEKTSLDYLRKAWAFFIDNPSRQQTVKYLESELGLSTSHSYAIIRDSIKLYGEIEKVDRVGLRVAKYEWYMRIAKLAEKSLDYATAIKASEYADKLERLFEEDDSKIPTRILFPPKTFIFVDDPDVLKDQQQEDADYEIVD
jgi:hypothetical protein